MTLMLLDTRESSLMERPLMTSSSLLTPSHKLSLHLNLASPFLRLLFKTWTQSHFNISVTASSISPFRINSVCTMVATDTIDRVVVVVVMMSEDLTDLGAGSEEEDDDDDDDASPLSSLFLLDDDDKEEEVINSFLTSAAEGTLLTLLLAGVTLIMMKRKKKKKK